MPSPFFNGHAMRLTAMLVCPLWLTAANPSAFAQTLDNAERQAAERAARIRKDQLKDVDAPMWSGKTSDDGRLPLEESPCMPIRRIELRSPNMAGVTPAELEQSLDGPGGNDPPLGHCLGQQGINLLMPRLQDLLMTRGHSTTKVLAPPQDLGTGVLVLQVMPGRIGRIRVEPAGTRAFLGNALPFDEGDVLWLPDLDQALENLQRVPTVQADIQIAPGDEPLTSDLLVRWTQPFPLRLNMTADDSGSSGTGKYQGSVTVSHDHAFTLNDLLYLSVTGDLGGGDAGQRGTRGRVAHYSLPWGYWLWSLNSSRNRYFQSVPGLNGDYLYHGTSRSQDASLRRVFARDGTSKSSASLKLWVRASENFIDDAELRGQRRRLGGYELGLQHQQREDAMRVDASAALKRGLHGMGANRAYEESRGEGTHQFRLLTADLQVQAPLNLLERKWHYTGQWRWQRHRTPLTPQDRFAIGGRYTVRGFDGESVLSGDSGWLVRNEAATWLGDTGIQAYAALDHGRVSGPGTRWLIGNRLTGMALGLRRQTGSTSIDVFAGRPVRMPEGFHTARIAYGASLSTSF